MIMFDVGLFIIRIAIGGLVLGHGLQKLVGWLDGPGVAGGFEYPLVLGVIAGA